MLGRRVKQNPKSRQDKDAVVILVSKSLASWLDDEEFLARIIYSTGISNIEPRTLEVLSAAVDEVPRYDRRLDAFCSSEGVSVLCGNRSRILPTLWTSGMATETEPGTKPSLVFEPPKVRYMGPLRVTVPLANTMFTNGRTHSLFASRWTTLPGCLPNRVENVEKTKEVIIFPKNDMKFDQKSLSTIMPALVPVTEPRKIVAGLGNILRQVEIDGADAPASKELEAIIPALLKQRRNLAPVPDHATGPVGVWALIIPPRYKTERLPLLNPLNSLDYRSAHELRSAKEVQAWMGMMLAGGAQLRKVRK